MLPLRGCEPSEAQAFLDTIEAEEKRTGLSGNQIYLNGHLLHAWMHDLVRFWSVFR